MAITRGNVVVPEEYVSEIIQSVVQESAALRLLRRVPMAMGIQHQPVMSALPSAGFVNPRDSGKKPLTDAQWEGVILTAEEVAAIVIAPEALIEDVNFDLWGEVTPRIGEALGKVIDAATFFGAGAPASWPANGIVGHALAAGNNHLTGSVAPDLPHGISGDIAEDLNQTMALVENDGFDVEGFASVNTLKAKLRGLRTAQGALLFQPSLQADTPDTLYGEDVYFVKNGAWNPALATAVAGDFDMAVVGIRRDVNIRILTEATFTNADNTVAVSLAETDQVALRVYMRLGFALANPVTQLNPNKATRSPWAVLQPAA